MKGPAERKISENSDEEVSNSRPTSVESQTIAVQTE